MRIIWGMGEITSSLIVPKARWPSGTFEMPHGQSSRSRKATSPGRSTLPGRAHQLQGSRATLPGGERPHLCLHTRPGVSGALLGPFFPRPWILTVQCSHCTQLAPCPAPLFPGLKRRFTAARTSCGNFQETRWFLSGHACLACCIKLLDISVFPRTTDRMQRLFATRL